jgi:hypothetical protein
MEPSKFDELTKALATATSRRQALKTIAATTIGGILGLAGIGTAFAKCHDPGHNCEENSTCCSQNCCIAAGQREGVCCASGQTCQNGTCVSPTTTTTTTTSGPVCPHQQTCSANRINCGSPTNHCLCVPTTEGTQLCAAVVGVLEASAFLLAQDKHSVLVQGQVTCCARCTTSWQPKESQTRLSTS